jgi:hypothetical protein
MDRLRTAVGSGEPEQAALRAALSWPDDLLNELIPTDKPIGLPTTHVFSQR